jgi:small redox-active disulfide protein 2
MRIQVLGPGCPKCHEAHTVVLEALAQAGLKDEVEKVSDFQEIAKLGVFSTPGLVVDGKVVCTGRVPSRKEVLAWLGK